MPSALSDPTVAAVLDRLFADAEVTDAELRKLEADNIGVALKVTGGKVYGPDGAAVLLGVKPTTLASRMKALGLVRTISGGSG